MDAIRIGLLLFPNLTQLDLTGPFEGFAKAPGAEVRLLWKRAEPVAAETGLRILADTAFADCPPLDVLCVPGGPGVGALMEDAEVLAFLRTHGPRAYYLTSVCTGSLVLGAAGLLRGRRATSHWSARDLLAPLGAIPTKGRVVRDGNVITGGGVTAGIDFALTVVAELLGREAAQAIQLGIEYAPAPPFDAGTPERASTAILTRVRLAGATRPHEREALVARVAERLAAEAC
jgi:cyclohexyl-isocyanide hydratase